MWEGRRVVLGVTGGVAAYKAVLLARDLTRRGALVDVVMTRGAREFVGAVTFEAVTRRAVRTSLWERDGALDHVTVADRADLVIIAPATAHVIARLAAGMADDLLTALVLAAPGPVLLAPAMNDEMHADAATTTNIATLRDRGWEIVGPAVGALAEGPSSRPGRMVEPDEIIAWSERTLYGPGPMRGLNVLVTAGPTREPIDPVRFVSNRSSGKMGYRIAEAAWRRGAEVTLISGPSSEPVPMGVRTTFVETTSDMAAAVLAEIGSADLLVMAAAPSDFRPSVTRDAKVPRSAGGFTLAFDSTDDILEATLPHRHAGLTTVGFALETGAALDRGRAKLSRKQLDMIVINDAFEVGAGFDVDTNAVTILDCLGGEQHVSLRSKADVAEAILNAIEGYRE